MTAFAAPTPPRDARGLLERLVLLHPGEAPAFFWSAAYFFFLLFSYYLLRPVRDTMGIRGELANLPWLWTCTTLATLVVSPLFAWIVARLPRRRFVPWLYRVIGLVLLGFWIALRAVGPKDLAVGYMFFVWVSVYNLLSTSVFWGFMADVFTQEQGKRLFGAIGVGGTLGGILGSQIAASKSIVGAVGPINLILAAALLLEIVAQCASGLCRTVGVGEGAHKADDGSLPSRRTSPEPDRNVWAGFVLIAKSSYLQTMVLYMLLFTITSSFLEFEQARLIKSHIAEEAERTRLLSSINRNVNILTLITQVFLTGRILKLTRGRGIGIGLLLLPTLTFVAFGALWVWPLMGVLITIQVARRAMHYAVDRPTREVLYTVLGPDAKYKSKSFIDTFVYRTGDLAGAGATGLCGKLQIILSAAGLVFAAGWCVAGYKLARLQKQQARRAESTEESPPLASRGSQLPVQSTPTSAGR